MKILLDTSSPIADTLTSRPAGLQASARKIQLTSVGIFLPRGHSHHFNLLQINRFNEYLFEIPFYINLNVQTRRK